MAGGPGRRTAHPRHPCLVQQRTRRAAHPARRSRRRRGRGRSRWAPGSPATSPACASWPGRPIGVITSIGSAHLEHLGGAAGVRREKGCARRGSAGHRVRRRSTTSTAAPTCGAGTVGDRRDLRHDLRRRPGGGGRASTTNCARPSGSSRRGARGSGHLAVRGEPPGGQRRRRRGHRRVCRASASTPPSPVWPAPRGAGCGPSCGVPRRACGSSTTPTTPIRTRSRPPCAAWPRSTPRGGSPCSGRWRSWATGRPTPTGAIGELAASLGIEVVAVGRAAYGGTAVGDQDEALDVVERPAVRQRGAGQGQPVGGPRPAGRTACGTAWRRPDEGPPLLRRPERGARRQRRLDQAVGHVPPGRPDGRADRGLRRPGAAGLPAAARLLLRQHLRGLRDAAAGARPRARLGRGGGLARAHDVAVPLIHGAFGEDGALQRAARVVGGPLRLQPRPTRSRRTLDKDGVLRRPSPPPATRCPPTARSTATAWDGRPPTALAADLAGLSPALGLPDRGRSGASDCWPSSRLAGGSSFGVDVVPPTPDRRWPRPSTPPSPRTAGAVLVEEFLTGTEFSVVVLDGPGGRSHRAGPDRGGEAAGPAWSTAPRRSTCTAPVSSTTPRCGWTTTSCTTSAAGPPTPSPYWDCGTWRASTASSPTTARSW